jgi:putative hydrolase of the HAD superfamily
VYIADNPYKDFVGIKPQGFATIRVLTGPYKDIAIGEAFEADWKIKDLSELPALIKKIGIT